MLIDDIAAMVERALIKAEGSIPAPFHLAPETPLALYLGEPESPLEQDRR